MTYYTDMKKALEKDTSEILSIFDQYSFHVDPDNVHDAVVNEKAFYENGVAIVYADDREEYAHHYFGNHGLVIRFIAVDVPNVGKGTKAISEFVNHAKSQNKSCIVLTCKKENSRAQHFFKKHGFKIAGEYQFPVTKSHGYVLRKDLNFKAIAQRYSYNLLTKLNIFFLTYPIPCVMM
jgi:ribosomal protein S18 acetylase RimI-like enzyme